MNAADLPDPLTNPLPRPPGERGELERLWKVPTGFRRLTVVNNTWIGLYYIGAALLFLVLGGVLALLMRLQLAVPDNDLVGYDLYNQLFTMHGSVMMFLFAVPVVEAIGVLLLPAMLGARDLPFPRLSAYAFWAYFFGGLVFFTTIFFDVAPDGGWFMYPPLTGIEFSPSLRSDFWLLGIGFIEISAIAGAIEIVVGILRTRPPGMTLDRMPPYAWAMLVVGAMIIFAFPPVILATALLELERAFDWPFFVAERGGDPVLWQHLFWLFGHPDVYIIFLPAAGLVSMMIPVMARTPLVGYRWIVASLISTGVISFALWVHHMFAIGMSHTATGLVSAASMLVAIPAAVQVFAWLATLHRGHVQRATPTWFLLGFFAVFVLGGLTGVMVAVVPYDWQVHDTYFVVAHLHYVLIGGMLFPVFAAIYFWAPTVGGRRLSERMGRTAAVLMFIGVNLTFFPMHFAGLLGMPRRVWTYADELGLGGLNLASTIGAFILAGGILLVLLDLLLHLRPGGKVHTNPWNAGTLEWLPMDDYAVRSIPRVESRDPLWDRPSLPEEVDEGRHFLPGSATGERETIVSSARAARPEYLLRLPGPSWLPLLAGLGTAAFFMLLTVKLVLPAALGGLLALGSILAWLWQSDPAPTGRLHDIGAGIRLPDHCHGPRSHAWWGVVVLLLVDATIFASLVFSFFYLWDGAPGGWPTQPVQTSSLLLLAAVVAWVATAGGLLAADRLLGRKASRMSFAAVLALVLALAWLALGLDGLPVLASPLDPTADAHGAARYALLAWQTLHVVLVTIMTAYTLARLAAGMLHADRRATLDSLLLIGWYTSGQGVLATLIGNLPGLVG